MNRFDAMYAAIRDAEETIRAADHNARKMAALIQGRLRNVDRYTLEKLKKELAQFNAKTGEWKS